MLNFDRKLWYVTLVFNKICVRSLEMIPLAVSAQVPSDFFLFFANSKLIIQAYGNPERLFSAVSEICSYLYLTNMK